MLRDGGGGVQVGVTKEKRIQYAQELLEKNFLPHVSISPGCQTAKVLVYLNLAPYRETGCRNMGCLQRLTMKCIRSRCEIGTSPTIRDVTLLPCSYRRHNEHIIRSICDDS